jgi:tRNA-dihydrouridine synthase
MGGKITDLFTPKTGILAFAPLEPDSANPILREIMAINGAELVFRPKILPQHLLKAKKWQFYEKMENIDELKTYQKRKVFDIIQLILRIDDPIKPAIEFINSTSWEIGVSGIDLNFSCPGYKVLPERRGGELLRDPPMILRIIEKTLKSAELPVSIKIRKGYSINDTPTPLCSQIAKEFGKNISWISINRAPVKMAGVKIEKVENDISSFQQALNAVEGQIPIIANGSIDSVQRLDSIIKNTPIHGFMIGRPALGNQNIFYEFAQYLQGNPSAISEKKIILLKELEVLFGTIKRYHQSDQGMWATIGHIKKMLFWYMKKFYEGQGRQLPAGHGFASWSKKKHTPETFIQSLNKNFPFISLSQWKSWLDLLIK